MEIKSIIYEGKTLVLFCDLRDSKDLKILSFILSGFASGYFCNEVSPEEIEDGLKELFKNITFEQKNLIYSVKTGLSIVKNQLTIFAEEIGIYEVIEERFLKPVK